MVLTASKGKSRLTASTHFELNPMGSFLITPTLHQNYWQSLFWQSRGLKVNKKTFSKRKEKKVE